ncbi:MAG: hypothetical protein KDE31_10545, partial [Caldilineaceae bacterium]|nr:hypothetical protein [Caldilineaceae bacterium]
MATLAAGQSHLITGLTTGEVVSAQGGQTFTYTLTEPTPATATPTVTPVATDVTPTATPVPCVDPTTCNPVSSIGAFWRCNTPGCTDADWVGSVISWPSWSAFEDNGRTGNQSRTVYSAQGDLLYPYMGPWANGCQITAVSGTALIIEWQRGTNVWREIPVPPGQSHTIALTSPEDGVVIEGPPPPGFSVSIKNCNPQVIEKTPTPTPTSTSSALFRIGETNILSYDDADNANLLIAQQTMLPQSGTIQSLSFYVTGASGQLRLGIYDDANGGPG